jgi:RNA polymerase sigma factor for flagellar operon FliA
MGRGLPPNVQHEELLSAGMEGLVRATHKYDPSRGDRFAAYAEFRVKGAMLDEIRRHDMMSRGGRLTKKALERRIAQLTAELGHPPTEDELAEALGLDVEEYRRAVRDLGDARVVSLERPSWSGQRWHEPIDESRSPEEVLDHMSQRKQLWAAVEELGERERLVIDLYFRKGEKLREIAERIGTTDSRVCQIKREAIQKLRELLL